MFASIPLPGCPSPTPRGSRFCWAGTLEHLDRTNSGQFIGEPRKRERRGALRLETSLSNWSGGRPGPAVRGPNQFRRWSRPGRGSGEPLGRPWGKQALSPDSVDHDMKRHVLEGPDQSHGRREFLLASYLHVLCFVARVRCVPELVGLVPLEVPPTSCVRVPVLWFRDEAANAARVLCAGFGSVTVIAQRPSLRQHIMGCKRGR